MPTHAFRLRYLRLMSALALTAPLVSPAVAAVPEGWFVWPSVEPAAGTALDNSSLNGPVGAELPRIGVKDGGFVTADGRRIRFFGVNVSSDDAFPSERDAELLARRLAKAGVNIVRLHHLDNAWGVGTGGSLWPKEPGTHRELDLEQLDKLHRLIAVLARHGIYSNLNLKVSKTLTQADGFPESISKLPDFQKRVDFFDRRMIELQKDYARRLLTTRNPYTGRIPSEDPAVALVEINNENSLLGYFTRDLGRGLERLPQPFLGELQTRWNEWLLQRYGKTETLAGAWNETSVSPGRAVLNATQAVWTSKEQPGSESRFQAGQDGSSFTVEVLRTGGADWHVQVSTYGLKLEENTVYTVAFEARASAPAKLGVGVSNDDRERPDEPWRSLGLLQSVDVGTDWTPVRLAFPAHSVGGVPAVLSFNVAAQTGTLALRGISLVEGAKAGGVQEGQTLEARTVPLPTEPTTRQWADWLAFLAEVDRSFAEEMRAFLRDELKVAAPLLCSQMNFTGLPALNREQNMEFADTHGYWQHPEFPGAGWDRANWRIANSPMVAVFGPRRFGELGSLAFHRVAGKPYCVSEYDHAAPSDFACEMYPELAVVASRQNWDAVYAFDLGSYGVRNLDGRITGYFDQLNHPAKWSLAPFATRLFRLGLLQPAAAVAELRPGNPVWGEAVHFDMLWAKLNPDKPFDFLNRRLQVNERPTGKQTTLLWQDSLEESPVRIVKAPQGAVLVATVPYAAVATGFLGGTTIEAAPLRISCPRFGRDFATVSAVALDNKPLRETRRLLLTLVARGENQGMTWNESRSSVGTGWGRGPTIAERVPATIELSVDGPRKVFALAPDGSRSKELAVSYADGRLSFSVSNDDRTLHYELVGN